MKKGLSPYTDTDSELSVIQCVDRFSQSEEQFVGLNLINVKLI